MQVKNKWNGNFYKIVNILDRTVTLEREDGSQFTIQKTDYYYNYIELVDKV